MGKKNKNKKKATAPQETDTDAEGRRWWAERVMYKAIGRSSSADESHVVLAAEAFLSGTRSE